MKSITGWLFFSALLPLPGLSQQQLSGKVRAKSTNEILAGVTVGNYHLHQHNTSDMGGNYRIKARPGDTLIFSSAGYHPDSLIVTQAMFTAGYDVYLDPNVVSMPSVKISETNNYQLDSIERYREYAWLLDKIHPVKLWNEKRRGDAPGLSFSPIGYFSKAESGKRRLKRRLKQEEEDHYIDYKFPRVRVAMFTGLKGDSLDRFMIKYRPSYKFCRTANAMDILLYINDKLVLYRKAST